MARRPGRAVPTARKGFPMSERLDNLHSVSAPVGYQADGEGRATLLKDRVRSLRLSENKSRQRSSGSWLPWLLCLLLAGACSYLAYAAYFAPAPVQPEEEPQGPAMTVQPSKSLVEKPAGRVALVAGGYIIPVQRVQVSPKVGGEVMEWRQVNDRELSEGDYVEEAT